jgi:hypothetical protein
MKWRHPMQVIFLALLISAAASAAPETNFSQYPGFARYFTDNPPAATMPNLEQRRLLLRHRPRILIAGDQPGPIDFYRDYIAHGSLYNSRGELVSSAVTPELLNRYKGDPRAEFRHLPSNPDRANPVLYARIDRVILSDTHGGEGAGKSFVFLTYHAAFRHSGLPTALEGWKAALLGLLGNLRDWHQLDHYTAVTVVLDAKKTPVAVMLQQHNYLRTHLIVRFADRDGMAYLMGFDRQPLIAADDVTDSASEVEYALEFLPPDDAFYTFQGFLGERRLLPGRSGPPGASYNTLPEMKPLDVQLLSGYWREGNAGDWQRYRDADGDGEAGFAAAQAPVFLHNLSCIAGRPSGCRLR